MNFKSSFIHCLFLSILIFSNSSNGRSMPDRSVVIVTACNGNKYFQRLVNFVGSVHYWEPDMQIKVFDLGFNSQQKSNVSTWKNVEVLDVPWNKFPSHINQNSIRQFAWKPLLMLHALDLWPRILYQDAGQEFRKPIDEVLQLIDQDGHFFVAQDGWETKLQCCGRLLELCHAGTLSYLNTSEEEMRDAMMCAGGIQGYVKGSRAYEKILKPTVECAKIPDCIAPKGATLANHRFDQAIFSIYLHKERIQCQKDPKFWTNRGNNRQPGAFNGVTVDPTRTNNAILFSRRGWGIDYDLKTGQQPYARYVKRKDAMKTEL